MFGFELAAEWQPWVALAVLVVMFVLFVRETYPVEVTAIGGAAVMIVTGILPIKDGVAVLSNAAPWTIVLMFLVMGGLVRPARSRRSCGWPSVMRATGRA